ncbi:MAG TPA: phage tail protein [Pyrinomonadaceae bacterium]|jgi:phage tail-like protein
MAVLSGNALQSSRSKAAGDNPYQVFNFFVEIDGVLSGGCTECSGLQVETEVQEYAEGGLNDYVHHFRGRTRYPPLILRRGLTKLDGLWLWHQDVVRNQVERKNGTIYLLDAAREPVVWWGIKGAFPVRWVGPELRAGSNDVAFESVELAHQGLSRPNVGGGGNRGGASSLLSLTDVFRRLI